MFEHNVRAVLIGIIILCSSAAHTSAQTTCLQLRENANMGGVSVVYDGRVIRTYPRDEIGGKEESKGIFLIRVGFRGGNGCFPCAP
jgi:hypothetical protein